MKDFLDRIYKEVSENIKFIEAKNGTLIALNSALIAISANKIFDDKLSTQYRTLLFFIIIELLLVMFISFCSLLAQNNSFSSKSKIYLKLLKKANNIKKSENRFMFYAYISKFYRDNFGKPKVRSYLTDMDFDINEGKGNEKTIIYIVSQIIDLSDIAYYKSCLFNISVIIESICIVIDGIVAIFLFF